MHRRWMLIPIVLACGLFVPAQALAAHTFQVKDVHGHVRGSFAYSPARDGVNVVCKVVDRTGVRAGTLIVVGVSDGFVSSAFHAPSASGTGGPTAWSSVGSLLYSGVPGENLTSRKVTIAKAVRAGGLWQIMKRKGKGYVKVGSVSSNGCPAEAALCAARLLLWPHDATLGVWKVKATVGTHGTMAVIWGEQNVNYAGVSTDTGTGATVWQKGDDGFNYVGLVGHEMTENGPVATMWCAWYGGSGDDTGYWAERVSNDLYNVVDPESGTVIWRVVRSATGPWHLQAQSSGTWETLETVPRSCPGGWVAGQLALVPLGD